MLTSTIAFARPADPKPIEAEQPDGSKITIILKGDERIKWAETEDGYSLLRGQDGFWEYATKAENGDMVASGVKVTATKGESSILSNQQKHIMFSTVQKQAKFEDKDSPKVKAAINLPAAYKAAYGKSQTINYKIPIILVSFQDKAWEYGNKDIDFIFNTHGLEVEGYTGSVVDYFHDNSRGKFQFHADIWGPYTISRNMEYYGSNMPDYDINAQEMVREALAFANSEGCDFSNYDLDNDGEVDGVHIIFAGQGEEENGDGNAIWSHQASLSQGGVTYNGKKIQVYSCSPELSLYGKELALASMGTAVHEIGHVLGLRDYYDTDYAAGGGNAVTPGYYEVMDIGCDNNNGSTPPQHNAYSKLLLGWNTEHILDSTAATVEIFPTMEENTTYIIKTQTANEFFVLDNRPVSKWDKWDITYPRLGAGLLIFAVDKNNQGWARERNTVNSNPLSRGLYIKQANGGNSSTSAMGTGTPFPGYANNTNFTDTSSPSSLSRSGKESGMPVTDIRIEEDNRVVFNLLGGGDTISSGGETVPPYLSTEKIRQQAENDVVIYPNPAKDKITVISNATVRKLTLYNMAGKQIAKSSRNQIYLGTLPAGMYILQVKTERTKTSHKIIKK
jgi:M6 family metalloprotease-like protein